MMRIVEEGNRKIAILKLIGNPLGEPDAKRLRSKIHDLEKEEVKHVILDMSGVMHINSSGLGGLVSTMFTMLRAKGDVRFVCIGRHVKNIFRMTRLDKIFTTDKTVDEALKHYRL